MPHITDPLRHVVEQRGVFLRCEAIALGLDDNALSRSLRLGVLTRVRHGSYTFTDVWEQLSDEDRHVVLGRAVMRRLTGVVLSHTTAAVAYGMATWRADLTRAHVTRIDGGAGHRRGDVVHHEGYVDPAERGDAAGMPAVSPVRAALETALLAGTEAGLVTVSSGLRLGLFGREALEVQHEAMAHWPDARLLHMVTRLARSEHESPGEVRAEHLFWSQGIPRPVAQYEVYDQAGRLIGRCDFAWPRFRLIVEFDGAVKYERHLRPGETPGAAVFREKQREDALRAAGWTVVRITWADLSRPRETAHRIRAAMRAAA